MQPGAIPCATGETLRAYSRPVVVAAGLISATWIARTTLGSAISYVVRLSSNEEMVWIYTDPYVALVQHGQLAWHRPVVNLPRPAVRALRAHSSVAGLK